MGPDQRQSKPGTLKHGGYWLWRILRSGAPNRRSAVGRRFEARRLAYALARGFPVWSAAPAPLQAAIDNCIRQEFFTAALFSGFWSQGVEGVARHYLTAAEALRRQLSDLGLDAQPASAGLQDYLRERYAKRAASGPQETCPGAAQGEGEASGRGEP